MNIAIEKLSSILILELDGLLNRHKEELCGFDDAILAPIWEDYVVCEEQDVFKAFIARENEKIVGYAGFFIKPHMHYANIVIAVQDVFYIDPDSRGGSKGIRLLSHCDRELKELGVRYVTHHAKVGTTFDKILPRLGYDLHEHIYIRGL